MSISADASRLRQLRDRIRESFRKQPHGQEHHTACAQFHREYDSLAFPGGLKAGLDRLKQRDAEAVESAIQFLEIDPRFLYSGYIKEELLRRLKHCELTAQQQTRLARLIIRSMDHGGRREFRGYSRLVRRIHPPAVLNAVRERLSSPDPEQVRRAQAVQQVLRSNHLLESSNR